MSEKQLSFEGAMMIVNDNKWIKLKDIEKLSDFIQEQQAIIEAKDSLLSILAKENEQLREKNKQIGYLKRDLFILINLIRDTPMEFNCDFEKIVERWE